MKTRGHKSSEFHLAVIGTACGVGMAFYGLGAGEIVAALSLAATYIGGRSFKKGMRGEE